jgi:MSHA biogenesis protein MshL
MKRDRLSPPLRLSAASVATLAMLALLGGCASWRSASAPAASERARSDVVAPAARATLPATAAPAAPAAAAPASATRAEAATEPRFDLVVNGAQVRDVFLAMVADTRYSMLMHPDVAGTLSLTLRGVTVREALDLIRDVYGYDYRIEGRRITIHPATMQTRFFTLNYLNTTRKGRSDLRVASGSARANPASGGATSGTPDTGAASSGPGAPDSSQVSSSSSADIWTETAEALRAIVGTTNGRSVVMSPQSGTIAVRAMPEELRQVEAFLRASRLALERQVMLEAKIVQVELREGFQSGIDWSVLRGRGALGQTSGFPNNPLITNGNGLPTLPASVGSLLIDSVALPAAASGTLGLSLATNGFSAVLGFLETHGEVQILSSPRVATLNNQKAVLKVGTDEYFVTNVSGGTITNATSGNNNATTTLPTLTLTPFFSGIALDVTPQIDEGETITLHVRPSVTTVTEKTKQIDLGTIGNYRLPLASSAVNETDTVVRVIDGNIVAIGGLMQTDSARSTSGLPGTHDNVFTRTLFGNTSSTTRKTELVVLIKPTIIRTAEDWQRATDQALAGIEARGLEPRKVITVEARPAGNPASGR